MPEVNIRGVPVTFPFKPYPNQIVYMERVIQGLSEGKNCLLEVPIIEPDLFDRCSVLIFPFHVKRSHRRGRARRCVSCARRLPGASTSTRPLRAPPRLPSLRATPPWCPGSREVRGTTASPPSPRRRRRDRDREGCRRRSGAGPQARRRSSTPREPTPS